MSGDDLHAGISVQQRQQGGTVAVMLRIGELPALQGSVYQNDNGAFFRDVGEVALDPCELLLTETAVKCHKYLFHLIFIRNAKFPDRNPDPSFIFRIIDNDYNCILLIKSAISNQIILSDKRFIRTGL